MNARVLPLILFPLSLYCQRANKPFLEEGKTWITEFPHMYDDNLNMEKSLFVTYTISGDTLISQKKMFKMYADGKYFCAMYEEAGKVFAVNADKCNMTVPIYDFSARKGDIIIATSYWWPNSLNPLTVTADSILTIEGRNYGCLYLKTHPHQNLRNADWDLFTFVTEEMKSDELERFLQISSQGIWIKDVGDCFGLFESEYWTIYAHDQNALKDDEDAVKLNSRMQCCFVGTDTLFYRKPTTYESVGICFKQDNIRENDTYIYDLLGKTLMQKPHGGIYINNRRKIYNTK